MLRLTSALLGFLIAAQAADLPSKKYLNLAAVKAMVAVAEQEAQKRNVRLTICIVDDSGNLLFLQRGDGATLNTVEYAMRKAKHAALYGSPSRTALESLKKGNLGILTQPGAFPDGGGVPIRVDGQLLGGIACSGAASAIDEEVAQMAADVLARK
ncbi:MAG: heme-binding protein [Bryobacteraceae bacterium]